MRFGVLGPVEAWDGGRRLSLGGPQQRALLAALLLGANRVVSTDRLVDYLWGEQPPATARSLLQGCVAGLRRVVRGADGDQPLVTRVPGYLLQVGRGELDLDRFEELAGEAARAAAVGAVAGMARAAACLSEALSLWRGPALDGIDLVSFQPDVARLEERRLAVLEQRIDLDLRLGRPAELVSELQLLAAAYPLRERLWAQLMLALFQAQRRADALAAYQRLRQMLVERLGVEPGATAQRLHRAILAGDDVVSAYLDDRAPSIAVRPAGEPARAAVPAQLPAAPVAFTGRDRHLDRLDELLSGVGQGPRVGVISGMAGVGKTSLAVHWAHRVRSRFPDGQLYVNLRGLAPTSPPPSEALAGFLQALGAPAEQVPPEAEQAAALYRTLLADRQVLIVLDNARDVEQIRPLLPGGGGCVVLVTSRDRLGGLVAGEGAAQVSLDVLTPEEARELLSRVLGGGRVGAEPAAATELAAVCAHLPLALRIAAANLSLRPWLSIADQVAELTTGDRLAALAVDGDEHSAVRIAFDQSYAALPAGARRLFRLLGLVPGGHFAAAAAAALAGVDQRRAHRLLDRLAGAHLIEQPAAGQYALHDLLRHYAAERARGAGKAAAAEQRLYEWYLRTVDAAADLLYPHMLRLPRPVAPAGSGPDPFPDHAAALGWLETERHNLVAAVRHAAGGGPRSSGWLLADALRGYFHLRRYLPDWLAVANAALAAAQTGGDLPAQAAAQHSLGTAYRSMGEHHRALGHYDSALDLARRCHWRESEATTLGNLGVVYKYLGRLAEAAEHLTRALVIDREIGRRAGEANNLGLLADVYQQMGLLDEAGRAFAEAVELNRLTGARHGEALALTGLGEVSRELGRLDDAVKHLTEALQLYEQVGDRDGQASAHHGLATVDCEAGRPRPGREHALAALALARDTGDPRTEATALNALGSADRHLGRLPDAIDSHRRAYALARETATRGLEIEALIGLARTLWRLGEHEDAAACAGQALAGARASGYRILEGQARAALTADGQGSG